MLSVVTIPSALNKFYIPAIISMGITMTTIAVTLMSGKEKMIKYHQSMSYICNY